MNNEVGQAERALGETVRQVVHRQLDFTEKKSLLKWQRAELGEWIEEHLAQLMDMGQLEEVLVDYLAQQQERTQDIVLRSQMHEFVFHESYHKNSATVKRRIRAHINKIDTRRAGLESFVQSVKTLKALKELLADRYERYRFDPDWF